jgi:ribonuclease D
VHDDRAVPDAGVVDVGADVAFEVTFVDEPSAVPGALRSIDAPVVGVDVERADAHLYYRRAALIQIGVPDHCVLLDAVTIEAFPEVDAFFGPDRIAVLHAIENDLEPLAGRGVRADCVADTAIAAAVLGLPIGLGALLQEVLGVELDGDKSAFQRADWEQRPLGPGMANYAAGDVVHLPRLWQELQAMLVDAGRNDWYEQELVATVDQAAQNRRDWTRVKGAGRLSDHQRAVLRAVWEARERVAKEQDIAPNRLIHDDVLRDLATSPPATEAQLVRRSQRRRSLLRRHAEPLMAAITDALDGPPEPKAGDGRRWTDTDRAAYDALRKRRAQVAKDLGVDAGVLCPSRPLWSAVIGDPEDADTLCRLAGLRPWQAALLAEPLWETYLQARDEGGSSPDDDTSGDGTPAD